MIRRLGVCLWLFAGSGWAATVARPHRELIVIADLSAQGAQSFRWLYRFVEANAVSEARLILGDRYQSLQVLQKEDATVTDLAAVIRGRAHDPNVEAIDLFVHLHGSEDELFFHDGPVAVRDVAAMLRNAEGGRGVLRAYYSTACYGGAHVPAMLAAGFRVASGARGVNANGAYDYPAFMRSWRHGRTFADAQRHGNAAFYRNLFDRLAEGQGFLGVDSYKDVFGNGNLTIDAQPLSTLR